MTVDPRIVSGARCVWWDSISKVGQHPSGLPCCPHCSGVLYEHESIEVWWSEVDEHEKRGNPAYRAMIEWMRGQHWRTWPEAIFAWEKHQSGLVPGPERQRLRAAIIAALVEINAAPTAGDLMARLRLTIARHLRTGDEITPVSIRKLEGGRLAVEALGITEVM